MFWHFTTESIQVLQGLFPYLMGTHLKVWQLTFTSDLGEGLIHLTQLKELGIESNFEDSQLHVKDWDTQRKASMLLLIMNFLFWLFTT